MVVFSADTGASLESKAIKMKQFIVALFLVGTVSVLKVEHFAEIHFLIATKLKFNFIFSLYLKKVLAGPPPEECEYSYNTICHVLNIFSFSNRHESSRYVQRWRKITKRLLSNSRHDSTSAVLIFKS